MRQVVLVLMFLCCAANASAEFDSVEFGPRIAFPLPTRDAGNTELGLHAGLTMTVMRDSWFGVGLDVAYQYWPVSADYKAAFEEAVWLLVIEQPTWAFKDIQVAAHAKIAAPVDGWLVPWVRIGGGFHFVHPNFEGHEYDKSPELGYFGSFGVDIKSTGNMKLGLEATYQRLLLDDFFGADFEAFTVGGRVLFVVH